MCAAGSCGGGEKRFGRRRGGGMVFGMGSDCYISYLFGDIEYISVLYRNAGLGF